uniref:Uncharacterized protein n=1 Tax=Oryza glumipatula TaxID=40148 RepID=A0A0E0ABT2_9ORYZ
MARMIVRGRTPPAGRPLSLRPSRLTDLPPPFWWAESLRFGVPLTAPPLARGPGAFLEDWGRAGLGFEPKSFSCSAASWSFIFFWS